jgi:potassium voltage-gated channel Shab-related subfamily B protein 1
MQIITIISIFFVVLLTFSITLHTVPELRLKAPVVYYNRSNVSDPSTTTTPPQNLHQHQHHSIKTLEDNPIFELIEVVCIAWFTLEYVLRVWSSPNKWKFTMSMLNIIDLVAILPYYLNIFLISNKQYVNLSNTHRIIQIFRVMRILRVLKLARHSSDIQALDFTLKKSYKELGLLMMFLCICILMFSSFAYFAEKDEYQTEFHNLTSFYIWQIELSCSKSINVNPPNFYDFLF